MLNALRGHLTEVGVIAPQGLRYARELAKLIEACDETIPFEVCEALAPGEVLLSSTVKDLVAGSGLSFRDHRAAALKGVQGEWKLYAAEG